MCLDAWFSVGGTACLWWYRRHGLAGGSMSLGFGFEVPLGSLSLSALFLGFKCECSAWSSHHACLLPAMLPLLPLELETQEHFLS